MKPRHVVAHSVWSGGQARGVHGNPTGGRQVFGWVAPASDEPKTVGQERLVVGLQVTIGAQLLPLMTQLVIWATTRLVPMLKRTGDWLKNHHRQIADLAPKILKVALALAGVFSAIKLVNIATSLTTSILGLVATPVGQVVLAVGAVAAAIAGLVAALIYAYHHCREFHDGGTRWSTASCRPGVGRSGSSRGGCRRRRWRGRRSASPPLHPSLHRTLNPHHVEENDMQFIQAAHHSADPNLPPTRVVIHATCPDVGFPSASRAGRAVGTAGYLASISASGSAHYVCDATETVQYLGEDVIGWLAPPNGHSIGIEICADGGSRASFNNPSHAYSPKQWLSPQVWLAVEKAAHLTRQICHRYAIPMRRLTVAGTPRRGCVRCRRRRSVSRVAGNRRCRWMFLTARRGGPARVQVRLRCPARSPERGPLLGWLPGGGAFVMPRHLPSPVGVIVPGTISSRSQQEIPSQRRTQLRSPDSPPDYPQNRPTPSPEGKKKTS